MGITLTAVRACCTLALGTLGAIAVGQSAAQSYPNKPIRVIVPVAPGGLPDILARILTAKLTETFKQVLVVDNRGGGGGIQGTETALKAAADGYTMLMTSSSYATSAALGKLPYDPVHDAAPIVLIGEAPLVMALHPSVPAKSIKELIALDKMSPGKLNYGTGGSGGSTHLATELFNHMAGTRLTHVPYKGTGPGLNGLLGGEIQFYATPIPSVISHLKTNRLRGIAVTTARRSSTVPDIPTVAETVSGYEASGWSAVFGLKDLPKDIAARWNSEINRILKLPDVKERMTALGMEPAGGSPDHLRDFLKREIAKWQNVVKVANIKAD